MVRVRTTTCAIHITAIAWARIPGWHSAGAPVRASATLVLTAVAPPRGALSTTRTGTAVAPGYT